MFEILSIIIWEVRTFPVCISVSSCPCASSRSFSVSSLCTVLLFCVPQTVDKASIQRLTESFVTKLQADFPSTVSTIYRLQLHTCFMHISTLNILGTCVLQVFSASCPSLTVKPSTCVTQDQREAAECMYEMVRSRALRPMSAVSVQPGYCCGWVRRFTGSHSLQITDTYRKNSLSAHYSAPDQLYLYPTKCGRTGSGNKATGL